jgi:N-glycosylase/DNA lyase
MSGWEILSNGMTMTQTLRYWVAESEVRRELPTADAVLMPGVRWGDHWALFTPAYWLSQVWMTDLHHQHDSPFKARGSLDEELVFCMLGGFGVTAELATAAFMACKTANLIACRATSADDWTEILLRPLWVNGRAARYRYPHQKAKFLSGVMAYLLSHSIDAHRGKELRDGLLKIRGVGPKTAGWVARNYLDADDVAILDVHIVRAGLLCGLFTPAQRVERNYFEMETRFLEFCSALDVRPAVMDCLIWSQMRSMGSLALNALKIRQGKVNKGASRRRGRAVHRSTANSPVASGAIPKRT